MCTGHEKSVHEIGTCTDSRRPKKLSNRRKIEIWKNELKLRTFCVVFSGGTIIRVAEQLFEQFLRAERCKSPSVRVTLLADKLN